MLSVEFRKAAFAWLFLTVILCWILDASTAGAVECVAVEISAGQPSSVIFVGDFESGSLEDWGHDLVFSATEVLDLAITVGFDEALPGDHVLLAVVTTPNGHTYQRLAVPISSDRNRSGALKKVRGYPKPMPVQITRGQTVEGEVVEAATLALPVGGTSIEASSIFGAWTIHFVLDGEALSCHEGARFMIVQ